MGASNVASAHANWRGLKHRARLLLDRMALVSIDSDSLPIYVASWVERAEFLGKEVPDSDGSRAVELVRKSAWQAQADAMKQLEEAGAIFSGHAVHNQNGYSREGYALNLLGPAPEILAEFSKKILDPPQGKVWTLSKKILDPFQGNPWSRNQEEPQDSLSGTTRRHSNLATDRARGQTIQGRTA